MSKLAKKIHLSSSSTMNRINNLIKEKTLVNTFTIVTTKGNSLLERIHNNPKLKGPRMPLILDTEMENRWIDPDNNDPVKIKDIIKPYPSELLSCHTVHRLRGNDYLGNVEVHRRDLES